MFRETGKFQCRVGKDIDRIGYDKKDSLTAALCDLRDDLFVYLHIFVNQIKPRLIRLLVCTRRDDNNSGIYNVIIVPGIYFYRSCKWKSVA